MPSWCKHGRLCLSNLNFNASSSSPMYSLSDGGYTLSFFLLLRAATPCLLGVEPITKFYKAVASRRRGSVRFGAHHKEWRHPVQICCQPRFNYDFICKIDDSYFQGLYEERRVASDSRLYAPEPLCTQPDSFTTLSA